MEVSQITTSASIYTALLCMAARFWGEMRPGAISWITKRWLWSVGCLAFLIHVWSAFQFHHHWSHASAFQVTAERTQEMLGFRFGEGIYFSYIFTLIWLLDVVWMWLSAATYQQRNSRLSWTLLCFLAFIAFNGAIVFEGGITRWLGLPIAFLLAWQAFHAGQQHLKKTQDSTTS